MKQTTPTYLWSAQPMCVGDEALLVYGADDMSNAYIGFIPKMKVIPVKLASYNNDKKEWQLNCYTMKDGKYVDMYVRKDENGKLLNYIIANTYSGILGRLIPYKWSSNL